jgi:predicted GIY-YIG superfamily endonuclease
MLHAYYVYILQCADGSYYTGLTTDLEYRVAQHNAGEIPGAYTLSRRPVKLIWFDEFPSKHEAFLRERQIKGWSRAKKEALIANDWDRIQQIVRLERQDREKKKDNHSD